MKAIVCAGVIALALAGCERRAAEKAGPIEPQVTAASQIEAGRYLVTIGGCNDCHTYNYPETGGQVAESDWLVGGIPFHGPWGTSYPSNLRLFVNQTSEDAWVQMLKTRNGLPPMPWTNLHKASETDLRAIHAFIKSLGPKGEALSGPLPPGQTPKGPYYYFVPLTGAPPKG